MMNAVTRVNELSPPNKKKIAALNSPAQPVRSPSGNNRDCQQREDSSVEAVLAPLPS
jgi:hypothetical protein